MNSMSALFKRFGFLIYATFLIFDFSDDLWAQEIIDDNPLVKHVEVIGNTLVSRKTMARALDMEDGLPLTLGLIREMTGYIKGYYVEKGYHLVEPMVSLQVSSEGKINIYIDEKEEKTWGKPMAESNVAQLVEEGKISDTEDARKQALDKNLTLLKTKMALWKELNEKKNQSLTKSEKNAVNILSRDLKLLERQQFENSNIKNAGEEELLKSLIKTAALLKSKGLGRTQSKKTARKNKQRLANSSVRPQKINSIPIEEQGEPLSFSELERQRERVQEFLNKRKREKEIQIADLRTNRFDAEEKKKLATEEKVSSRLEKEEVLFQEPPLNEKAEQDLWETYDKNAVSIDEAPKQETFSKEQEPWLAASPEPKKSQNLSLKKEKPGRVKRNKRRTTPDSWERSGKNWKAGVKTMYIHDDNVVQTPRDGSLRPENLVGTGDSGFNLGAFAKYNFKISDGLNVAAEYYLDTEIYTELTDNNLVTQMFGILPRYKFTPLMNIDFRYSYIYNINDGESFSGSHFLGPSFNHMHKKLGMTRAYYYLKLGNNFINNDRDKTQHIAGIAHYLFFSKFKRRVAFTYQYTKDDTDGSNFDRDINLFKLNIRSPLLFGLILRGGGSYSIRDYDTFLSDNANETRQDYRQRYSVSLSKVLFDRDAFGRLILEGKYRHIFNQTNLNFREYTSNRFDVGLKGKF
jgi:hypothetical protein